MDLKAEKAPDIGCKHGGCRLAKRIGPIPRPYRRRPSSRACSDAPSYTALRTLAKACSSSSHRNHGPPTSLGNVNYAKLKSLAQL
jgi:hypothetical protein